MRFNIFNIAFLIVMTLTQMIVPIAQERTYFSYVIPVACILFRLMFVAKTFGFPINAKVPPMGELTIYILTMFFMLSAYYKKRFPLEPVGIVVITVSVLFIMIIEFIEDQLFIYEYREIEEEEEQEDE